MNKNHLNEDKRLPKIPIELSTDLKEKIENIFSYNEDKESLNQWYEDLTGFLSYLSNPVIAWGNHRDYNVSADGEIRMTDLGYSVSYMIKENPKTNTNFIYINNMTLKTHDFGLYDPN